MQQKQNEADKPVISQGPLVPAADLMKHEPPDAVLAQQRTLLHAFPLHIGCIDETGCYNYWNPHSEKMFGYAAREVIGLQGPEVIFAAKGMAQTSMRAAAANGIFSDDVLLRHRQGYVFPARIVILPLKKTDEGGTSYYEFAHDISLLTATKREIEELKAALTVLLRTMEEEKKEYRDNLLTLLNLSIVPHLKQIAHSCTDPGILASLKTIHADIDYFKTNCFSAVPAQGFELTPTEVKVARLVASGKSTKEIARSLSISSETVIYHRKNIRKKLGICNRKVNLCSHIASLKG